MYDERIEQLISAALADGVLTEKEKQVLFKKAQEQGIDLDEFEMVVDARLYEIEKAKKVRDEKDIKQSAPKSGKYGDVRKCPACGAIVGAFVGVCEECGYEFSNIAANASAQKFYEVLSNEEDYEKQLKIIETFPIPNAKADLLEFLTALKPRVLDTSDSEYAAAYLKKYSECIEKAKATFPNDKLLREFVDDFDNLKSQLKKNERKDVTIGIVGAFLPLFLAITLPLLISFTNKKIQEHKVERCITYINEGQADKAKEILPTIKFKKKTVRTFYDVAIKLVEFYVDKGDIDKAYDVYGNYTPRKPNKFPYNKSLRTREGTDGHCRNLIKDAYIAHQQYDEALKCVDVTDKAYDAEKYYKFMSDVIYHLCKNGKKSEAKNFVAEYSIWFERNVDTNSSYKDGEYSYSKAKARLLKVIANY